MTMRVLRHRCETNELPPNVRYAARSRLRAAAPQSPQMILSGLAYVFAHVGDAVPMLPSDDAFTYGIAGFRAYGFAGAKPAVFRIETHDL